MTKQTKMMIGTLVVAWVLIVAGVVYLLRGNSAPSATPPVQPVQYTPPTAGNPPGKKPGAPGKPKPGAPGKPNGGPSAAKPAGPGVNPGATKGIFASSPPKGPAAAQAPKTGMVAIKHRSDPFLIGWKKKPLPPPVFDVVLPVRLASADIVAPPAGQTIITEVPSRRVSGILTGDGVYAVLEDNNGDTEIVKPGSVTSDGYRVVAINADSVKLQRKDGNLLRTQTVPLSDATTAPVTVTPAGYPGAPGMNGPPGGYPGGGYPGAGGGGRGGKGGGGIGGAE
ncbi:MAG TPA: hypothetical protein VKT32_14965 [Chthonomonadaceae bacterium]|nr:hypothetical protein [Chthonomonadaceae bacterium]